MQGDANFVGVGHNAIIRDDAGDWYIVYHGFDTSEYETYGNSNRRSLLIDRLDWSGDFPHTEGYVAGTSDLPVPVIN